MKLIKFLLVAIVAGLAAWIGRLMAHSKVPLPEGRWREIDLSQDRTGP